MCSRYHQQDTDTQIVYTFRKLDSPFLIPMYETFDNIISDNYFNSSSTSTILGRVELRNLNGHLIHVSTDNRYLEILSHLSSQLYLVNLI